MENDSTPQPQDSPLALDRIYEEVPVGLCIFDTDLRYVYINAWLAALNGISEEDHLGKTVGEVLPNLASSIEPQLQKVIETGQRVVDGTVIGSTTARWGEERHFQHTYHPIISGNGSITGVNCVVQDVTDRTRVENALKLTQFAIDHAVDPAFFIREDASFFYVNEAACRALGYSREELLSLSVHDIDPDYPRDTWADHWREMREGRIFTFEAHHRTKDGRVFPVEITANHLEFQGIEYNCAFARDITERKRGERRRRAHHMVTRVLAEATSLSEATPSILNAFCRNLGWAFGALWWIDANAHRLRCVETWQRSPDQLRTFVARTREITFAKKVGLPGRVWASNQPAWIPEVTRDSNLSRASVAAHDGLHAAFAFPIRIKGDVEGVMEFFSSQIHQPDDDLLRLFDTVGSQIGQFIERRHAEEALHIKTNQLDETVEAMTRFVETCSWKDASAVLLRSALKQTQSEYGFIGVVAQGPVLRILAHEGIVWDAHINQEFYQQAQQMYETMGYLEFTNFDNLFGRVITEGKVILSNESPTDPRAGGRLPPGHPSLRSFLGVPVYRGDEVVGIIGVANRPGGYTHTDVGRLRNLTHAAGVLYDSYRRSEHEITLEAQRKRVDQALQEREGRLRAIFESTHDAIAVVDPATECVVEVNARASQLLGYTKEELSGLPCRVIHPREMTRLRTIVSEALSCGRTLSDKLTCRAKDGRLIPVEIAFSSLHHEGQTLVLAMIREITESRQSEANLQASLREKEVLVREIQHRVKNNLQLIDSLLQLQTDALQDPQAIAVLREFQARVHAMALVHDHLYHMADLQKVNLNAYLSALVHAIFQIHGVSEDRIVAIIDIQPRTLTLSMAMACGLLVSECISNALKHAFPADRSGIIRVTMRRLQRQKISLTVRDNGLGMPKTLDTSATLGMRLIKAVATRQLHGTLRLRRRAGTSISIVFPLGAPPRDRR